MGGSNGEDDDGDSGGKVRGVKRGDKRVVMVPSAAVPWFFSPSPPLPLVFLSTLGSYIIY